MSIGAPAAGKSREGRPWWLVPEEESSDGFLETLESGLDFLRPDSETEVGEPAATDIELQPERAAETSDGTPQSEEIAHADADDGPAGGSGGGTAGEEQEGWLENVLQYLQPRTPTSQEDDPGPPSGSVEGRQ